MNASLTALLSKRKTPLQRARKTISSRDRDLPLGERILLVLAGVVSVGTVLTMLLLAVRFIKTQLLTKL
jgi:hypothetical protein